MLFPLKHIEYREAYRVKGLRQMLFSFKVFLEKTGVLSSLGFAACQ